ncbi:hypothetical protein HZB60_05690 [candidate division KSB1 bacterium]|nr:hypothetical protein [candidate division KSB1 bacterium]
MMKTTISLVFALLSACSVFAQVTIDATNWPYGADQIGNYWDYFNTASNTPVNIAALNPSAQGGNWDFTNGPTTSTATSEIHATGDAPAPAPANTSYTEYQTMGGSAQWVYEDELADGTWGRGISQNGSVYTYNAPQWNIYHYPMTMGSAWTSAWTWSPTEGMDITSSRVNSVVGWGTVTVPFGGPLSCLVIRTYSTDHIDILGIPYSDENYRIYEWVVPGIGSVCTIQSVSMEANWNFTTAAGYYRLSASNLGGDLLDPTIAGVTVLTDTPFPGPYAVNATITDASGIDSAALFYSIAAGPWIAVGPQSVIGDVFSFQIPQMSGSPVQNVRYYVWARDAATNANTAVSPAGAPGTNYSFNWINDNIPPAFSSVTVWPSPTNFNGPYPVHATITDDNGILFASIHYKFGGGAWQEAPSDSNTGSAYHFTIPGISSTTIIRYYLEAVDNSGFFNTGFHPAAGSAGPIVFNAVFTVPAAPQVPLNLTAIQSAGHILLNWSPVTQDVNGNPVTVSGYNIYRGLLADGADGLLIGNSPTNSYTDLTAPGAGNLLIYHVRAVTP